MGLLVIWPEASSPGVYRSVVGLQVTSKRTSKRPRSASQDCCCQCPCPPGRSLPTHASTEDPQTLTGRSALLPVGSVSFSRVLVSTRFYLCPTNVSVSPSPVEVLYSNSAVLQSQIAWGFQVPLLDPQVRKSDVVPRTFATIWELLWYYRSSLCGSLPGMYGIWF